jgi:hypothetical protein
MSFGERRILEEHVPEIFHRPAIEEYGLTNMNNFGCALPYIFKSRFGATVRGVRRSWCG